MVWKTPEPTEAAGGLVNIGPNKEKGQRLQFAGVLLGFRRHPKHPDRERVWALDKDGQEVDIIGNADIMRFLSAKDIGHLFKLKYEGEERSGGGSVKKKISVLVWDDEPWTEAMKAWAPVLFKKSPELVKAARAKIAAPKSDADEGVPPDEEFPPDELPEGDDDLPF